jgi:hypothetical protein
MLQLQGIHLDKAEAVTDPVLLNMAAAQLKLGDFTTAAHNATQVWRARGLRRRGGRLAQQRHTVCRRLRPWLLLLLNPPLLVLVLLLDLAHSQVSPPNCQPSHPVTQTGPYPHTLRTEISHVSVTHCTTHRSSCATPRTSKRCSGGPRRALGSIGPRRRSRTSPWQLHCGLGFGLVLQLGWV